MLEDRQGVVGSILTKAGVQPERVRDVAEAELGRLPQVSGAQPRTAPATMQPLQKAEAEAKTRFMHPGDTVKIWMEDEHGKSIFGAIEQKVVEA